MRVIKTLLFSLIGIALLAGVGFLVGREIILQVGLSQLNSAITQMRTVARQSGAYAQDCREKGPLPTGATVISAIQLRFTSATEYQVEVICSQFQLSPIIVATYTLPPLVTKVPESTGIIWQEGVISGVSLEVWGRQRSVVVEDRRFVRRELPPVEERTQPVTSCSGYGYTCCVDESTQGVGTQVLQVLDCPKSCFSACQARPLVLALTSQPFYDQETKEVRIGSGEVVEFRYVIQVPGEIGVTVTLDFGDGVAETLSQATDGTSHTYTCSTGTCRYLVKVSAVDANGATTAATPIGELQVVVQ